MMRDFTFAIAVLLASGCYSPMAADCAYLCSDEQCPAGLSCDGDGFCRAAGFSGSCRTFDADVDAAPCVADATHMMVFLDPADAPPTGWTCVSCGAADPLFHRFPMGAGAFGTQGGTTMHAHTFTLQTSGTQTTSTGIQGGATESAAPSHTHAGTTGTTSTTTHLPPYRDLKIIRPLAPTVRLPAGAIIVLDTPTLPNASFARFTDVDGLLIRGGDTAATGGTATHTHTFSAAFASSSLGPGGAPATGGQGAVLAHNHGVSGTTAALSNEPDHALVVLARATTETDLPAGMIAMFDLAPAPPWTVLSDPSGPLAADFLKASSSADLGPHGASSHTHAQFTGSSAASSLPNGDFLAGTVMTAVNGHTHPVTVVFATANQRPPYAEVILAKLGPSGCQ